jgi:hypothetical protein
MIEKVVCVSIFAIVLLMAVLARWDLHTKYMDKSCVWQDMHADCPVKKAQPEGQCLPQPGYCDIDTDWRPLHK